VVSFPSRPAAPAPPGRKRRHPLNSDHAYTENRTDPRNLAVGERLEDVRFLIHDRDAKFCGSFDAIIRSEGVRVIETPLRAPKANAIAERWVRSVRNDCLDHILVFSRRHLERVLRRYVTHYNLERPHRSLALAAPSWNPPEARGSPPELVCRRDVLGGLIHEYYAAAA
jgi:putative transposase